MRHFRLEEYNRLVSEGKTPKIVTRNGREATILDTSFKSRNRGIVILAKILDYGGFDATIFVDSNGLYDDAETKYDLFFAPKKHEGWMAVYDFEDSPTNRVGGVIYSSEDEAKKRALENMYSVAHVEWEE